MRLVCLEQLFQCIEKILIVVRKDIQYCLVKGIQLNGGQCFVTQRTGNLFFGYIINVYKLQQKLT